ncbi:lytic transglycosylase F [Photobacterium carnosum]|uniref:transglycosylase SLT domain-containing protein n=1 Tax=Photobacterium carnosum TaxID=2023717 RepID=UPI001E513CF6|nr:lytic transglycosylase F [Photobacterium carnosum]MCD9498348.1 transporter substrate-binding domain-containing protein [Photobacterium carnosum]
MTISDFIKYKYQLISLCLLLMSFQINAVQLAPLGGSKYVGDLTELEKKRVLRVLVAADLGFYYIEDGITKGIIADLLQHFEQNIRKKHPALHLQIIPVHRDKLLPYVINGLGDIAIANITVTAERKKRVAFSEPVLTNISEVLINNNKQPPFNKVTDLSGQTIWVRKSSSYHESLLKINNKLRMQNLPTASILFIDETLQDYELLELINLDLLNATVIDNHKIKIWQPILKNIRVNDNFVLRNDGQIAWAMRKDSPKLMALVNHYIDTVKEGTLIGNIIYSKYIKNHRWLHTLLDPNNIDKIASLSPIFFRYSKQYDFDYLMLMAQGFQESGLNQHKVSNKGAVGIMQVLPSTARDPSVDIPNIYTSKNNIHAGVKYMRYLQNQYFSSDKIDYDNKIYLSLAAYNAGPGNINKMRRYAKEQGYNPNIWFNNVELITRKHIGLQPIVYVNNINRYFIVYKQIMKLQRFRDSGIRPFIPPYKFDAPVLFK